MMGEASFLTLPGMALHPGNSLYRRRNVRSHSHFCGPVFWLGCRLGGWVPGSTSPPPGVETSMAQACFLVPFLAL